MGFTNAATGLINGNGFGSIIKLKYSKDIQLTIEPDIKYLLLPESNENRRIEIVSDKEIEIYYENQNYPLDKCYPDGIWIDWNCGDNLYVLSRDTPANITILVRSDKPINYDIGGIMIPVRIRLAIGTGANYQQRNTNDFDADSYQYLINLNKLKNSDSGATGYKLFDIFSFYPGREISFDIDISNPSNYGAIGIQLFDPLDVGETIFDVANDVVNLELNNLGSSFIGNLTKSSITRQVINNQIAITPDFSRHIGRFVAVNQSTGMFDTAIIESYTPNTDPYKGGLFTLSGMF